MTISALRNMGNIGRLMTRNIFRCNNKMFLCDDSIEITERRNTHITSILDHINRRCYNSQRFRYALDKIPNTMDGCVSNENFYAILN